MDVFISWSGERSKKVAEALHSWLPKIINAVVPYMSVADIDKGTRWATDIASKLESARIGIICITPDSLRSDWILFEAGALSKTLENTYVCPLLVGLEPSEVKGPLAQFQATRATKEEICQLLQTINSQLGDAALSESHLNEAFEVWWPKLKARLDQFPPEADVVPRRSDRDILEEILATVRRLGRAPESHGDASGSEPIGRQVVATTPMVASIISRMLEGEGAGAPNEDDQKSFATVGLGPAQKRQLKFGRSEPTRPGVSAPALPAVPGKPLN